MQCFISDITGHKYFNTQKGLSILPTQDHLDLIYYIYIKGKA